MESNTFKSVAFGGFDKQDVVHYIENTARTHAEELRSLQAAADALRQENDVLTAQNTELTDKCEQLEAQVKMLENSNQEQADALARLRQEFEALAAEAASLRSTASTVETLKAEVLSLRADAESYRQFRNRIGDIECDARKRAVSLEESTHHALLTLISDFNSKYQQLSSTFDAASSYVTTELRKIDVMLSQLPRAMDQLGTDLNALENSLRAEKNDT